MSLFQFFRRRSAPIARERLKILLAHDHVESSHPDLLSVLRGEIFAVIGRHVSFEPDNVRIRLGRRKSTSTLAVDIEIPNGCRLSWSRDLIGYPSIPGSIAMYQQRTNG